MPAVRGDDRRRQPILRPVRRDDVPVSRALDIRQGARKALRPVRQGTRSRRQPQGPVQQPVEPAQPELPRTGTYTPPAMPVDLYCAAMHITIPLIQGAVIGRTTGNYTAQLGQCIYISGTHASLGQDAAGWTITDLGSRNGTKVNGVACVPHQPARINVGNIVRIANFYDFVVR